MVSGGYHIYPEPEESICQLGGYTVSVGCIFTVHHHDTGTSLLDDAGETNEKRPAARLTDNVTEEQGAYGFSHEIPSSTNYLAYSTIRVSRIMVTLIRPGYLSSDSIFLAISFARTLAESSVMVL